MNASRTRPARPNVAALLAATTTLVLLAGCDQAAGLLASAQPRTWPDQAGPAVQIGGGVGPAGPWSGWLYPTATGYCISLADPVVRDGDSCGSGSEAFDGDIGVGASGSDAIVLAYGSTKRPGAAVATISTADGQVARIPIVRPGGPTANAGRELDRYPIGP